MGKRRDDDDDDDCEDEQDKVKEAMKQRKMNIKKKKFIVRKPKLCDSQLDFFDKLESCKKEEESKVICKPEPEDPCKPKTSKPIAPPKPPIDPCKPTEPCKLTSPSKTKEPIAPPKPPIDPCKPKDPCKLPTVSKTKVLQSLPKPSKVICKSAKDVSKGQKPGLSFQFLRISKEKFNAAAKMFVDMQRKFRGMGKKPGVKTGGGPFQKLKSVVQNFLPKPKDSSKAIEGVCKPKPKPNTLKRKDPCKPPESVCKQKDPCKPPESVSKSQDPCKPKDPCTPKDPCKDKPPPKLKFLRSSQEMIDAAAKQIIAKNKKFKEMDMKPIVKTGGPLQKLMSCAQKCLSLDSLKKLNFKSVVDKASDAMSGKGAGIGSRPMKYPYTFSAKCAQFPLRFYAKNQWIWKYYFVAVAVCLPVFYKINGLANSPGNVAKWAEIRRKEAQEHHH